MYNIGNGYCVSLFTLLGPVRVCSDRDADHDTELGDKNIFFFVLSIEKFHF